MSATKGEPTLISSVQRALHLLEAVAGHEDGAQAKRLARETRLPLGTTYHLLRTLAHEGYLHKLDDGSFVLGDALETLREQSQPQAALSRVRPALAELRDELGMAAYLARYDDGELRVAEVMDGPKAPRVQGPVELGEAGHANALGKCVLRQLAADYRADYLSRHPLLELTPYTLTRTDELLRSLERASSHDLTWDDQEFELGTGCAAVPITDGRTPGALAVSFRPDQRGRLEHSADRLRLTARLVSYTLTFTM